jgi:hypothetical protein
MLAVLSKINFRALGALAQGSFKLRPATFQLGTDSLREAWQDGQAFAELLAPSILSADESRRAAMTEDACAHLRDLNGYERAQSRRRG